MLNSTQDLPMVNASTITDDQTNETILSEPDQVKGTVHEDHLEDPIPPPEAAPSESEPVAKGNSISAKIAESAGATKQGEPPVEDAPAASGDVPRPDPVATDGQPPLVVEPELPEEVGMVEDDAEEELPEEDYDPEAPVEIIQLKSPDDEEDDEGPGDMMAMGGPPPGLI